MKNLIVILFLLLGTCAQAQMKYFEVDPKYSSKITPKGINMPPPANREVNSSAGWSIEGEKRYKKWTVSILQDIFGKFPVSDDRLRLLNGVSIVIGLDERLRVTYYEYRVEKEVFNQFVENEELFYRLGKVFLAEDMSRYYRKHFPELYYFSLHNLPLGLVYRVWWNSPE